MSRFTHGLDTPFSPLAQISPMSVETQTTSDPWIIHQTSNSIFRSFGTDCEIWDTLEGDSWQTTTERDLPSFHEIEDSIINLIDDDDSQSQQVFHDASTTRAATLNAFNPATPVTNEINLSDQTSSGDTFHLETRTPDFPRAEPSPIPPRPVQRVPPFPPTASQPAEQRLHFAPPFIPGAPQHRTSNDKPSTGGPSGNIPDTRPYQQILFDNILLYTKATAYPHETVAEREVRGRAFADGIDAAFRIFGEEGVSQAATSNSRSHHR